LKIFDAKPLPAKDPKGIVGSLGEIVAAEADGFTVVCADGRFKIICVQPAHVRTFTKINAGEFAVISKLAIRRGSHDVR
jgi:methionyl-tRNA formyltransferase